MSRAKATIRSDSAPAFQALVHDQRLSFLGLEIDLGFTNKVDENPISEKTIQELEQ